MHKQMQLSRRQILKLGAFGMGTIATRNARVWASDTDPAYQGPLLVSLQLEGGLDVTQFCDPKVNTPGERKINHWADNADPSQHGRISFAPIADNERFFSRFGRDTLVVNGVDAQTNSHDTGQLFNWTGSNSEGQPSLSALFAAAQSPSAPFAYNVFGGRPRTAGLITYNRIGDTAQLRGLVEPNRERWSGGRQLRPEAEMVAIQQHVTASLKALLENPSLTPRQRTNVARFGDAVSGRDQMRRLVDVLPDADQYVEGTQLNIGGMNLYSNLKQQMQSALLVFQSGLGSAADLVLSGFDSHDNHDAIHEGLLSHLSDAIHYFWEYAETLGLAERITLIIGSDFGRTNCYNDGAGKDHWPIGSYLIMGKDVPWGNRVVGATDELHYTRAIDPTNLRTTRSARGVVVTPAHIHRALRQQLGIEAFAETHGLGLSDTPLLPLFEPQKMTLS